MKKKTWTQTPAQLVDTITRETQRAAEKSLVADRIALRQLPEGIFTTAEGGQRLGGIDAHHAYSRLDLLREAGYLAHVRRDGWRKTEHGKEFERCA